MNVSNNKDAIILEKRGRGRGFVTTMIGGNPWAVRSFYLAGQSWSYYDSDKLKGTISTASSKSRAIDMSKPSADRDVVAAKNYPFVLETKDGEKVYLSATSEYFRLKCLNILNRSSSNANWNNEKDNEIAENEIQMQLTGKTQLKEKHVQVIEVFKVHGAKHRFKEAKACNNQRDMRLAATDMIIASWRRKQAKKLILKKKFELEQLKIMKRKLVARRIIIQFLRSFCAYRVLNRLRLQAKIAKKQFDAAKKITKIFRRFVGVARFVKMKRKYVHSELYSIAINYVRGVEKCGATGSTGIYLNGVCIDQSRASAARRGSILQGMSKEELSWVLMQQKAVLFTQSSLYHIGRASVATVSFIDKPSLSALTAKTVFSSTSINAPVVVVRTCQGFVCTNGKPLRNIVATAVDESTAEFLGQSVVSRKHLLPLLLNPAVCEHVEVTAPLQPLEMPLKLTGDAFLEKGTRSTTGAMSMSISSPSSSYNICGPAWKLSDHLFHRNTWIKRWFVLLDGTLQYFNSEFNLEKPKRVIACHAIIAIDIVDAYHGRNAVKVVYREGGSDHCMYIDFHLELGNPSAMSSHSIYGPFMRNRWMRVLLRNCPQIPDPTLEEARLIGPNSRSWITGNSKYPAAKFGKFLRLPSERKKGNHAVNRKKAIQPKVTTPVLSNQDSSLKAPAPILSNQDSSLKAPAPILSNQDSSLKAPAPILSHEDSSLKAPPTPILSNQDSSLKAPPAPILSNQDSSLKAPPTPILSDDDSLPSKSLAGFNHQDSTSVQSINANHRTDEAVASPVDHNGDKQIEIEGPLNSHISSRYLSPQGQEDSILSLELNDMQDLMPGDRNTLSARKGKQ